MKKTYYKIVTDCKEYSESELKKNSERILISSDIICDLNFNEVVGTSDTEEEAEFVANNIDVKPYYYGKSKYIMIPIVWVQKIDVDDDGDEKIDDGYDYLSWCDYEAVENLINGKSEDDYNED